MQVRPRDTARGAPLPAPARSLIAQLMAGAFHPFVTKALSCQVSIISPQVRFALSPHSSAGCERACLSYHNTEQGQDALQDHLFFFFNDTATTEIYTLSLHDALPI